MDTVGTATIIGRWGYVFKVAFQLVQTGPIPAYLVTALRSPCFFVSGFGFPFAVGFLFAERR